MNCDLLGHCISLGRNPCREDQDGQGGFIFIRVTKEKKYGVDPPITSSAVYKGYEAAKLARIKVLKLN